MAKLIQMENKDQNRQERILNSLEGIQKATTPDFFFTRLIGKMQTTIEEKPARIFLLRPAFIIPTLMVLFAINIISYTQLNKSTDQKTTNHVEKPATLESFAKAYNLGTASVYE